jgi:hypothetical protein
VLATPLLMSLIYYLSIRNTTSRYGSNCLAYYINSLLKGLSHEMDLAFNNGTFYAFQWFYNVNVFLAVNACMR